MKHRLFETAEVKALPHPVTMLHISNAVDEDSMKASEEVYKLLIGEILGKPVQYSEYFRAWKKEHGGVWIRMLERRKTTQYGGIFESENQRSHKFGGTPSFTTLTLALTLPLALSEIRSNTKC